jgi:hypothetical protein
MEYSVALESSGLPGFARPSGSVEIWGFSQQLTNRDVGLICALLRPASNKPLLLAVRSAPDVLEDWNQRASLDPGSIRANSIIRANDWFLMLTRPDSDEFHRNLTAVWSVHYAADIHLASAEEFWLGHWFSGLCSKTVSWKFRKGFESSSALLVECEKGADGHCLLLHTWSQEAAERHLSDIETIVMTHSRMS